MKFFYFKKYTAEQLDNISTYYKPIIFDIFSQWVNVDNARFTVENYTVGNKNTALIQPVVSFGDTTYFLDQKKLIREVFSEISAKVSFDDSKAVSREILQNLNIAINQQNNDSYQEYSSADFTFPPDNAGFILLTFSVVDLEISVLLPPSLITTFFENASSSNIVKTNEKLSGIFESLPDETIGINAFLGEVSLHLSDFLDLNCGDVIKLSFSPQESIQLCLNNVDTDIQANIGVQDLSLVVKLN